MRSFTGIPGAAKLEARMERNVITRLLTSHVSLAFCYGIFLFLYDVALLRKAVPAIHPVLIAWAGCLFLYDVLVRQLWKKMPYWPPLLVFAVATGLTVLLNREIGLVTGVKSAIMMVLPLVAFYPVCTMATREERKKALLQAMLGAAVLVFLLSLAALVMYLIRYSKVLSFMGATKVTGYRYYIREDPSSGTVLFGFYEDTNHAAAFAAVFTAYSLVLYRACKDGIFAKAWQNKLGRVFAVANGVVQILYFPLANSRGGWLCLIIALLMILGLWIYNVRLTGGKKAARALKAIALAALCVAVVCGGLVLLRTVSSQLSTMVSTAIKHSPGHSASKPGTTKPTGDWDKDWDEQDKLWGDEDVAHDSFSKADKMVGSGRTIIWKDALELFLERPILGDMTQHKYYAEKYDVAKSSLFWGIAVHNSYLDLLVSNGLVGFLSMMTFWVLCLVLVLRKLFRDGKKLDWSYYALAFCVIITAGTSFFLSCIFVTTTATYFIMLVPTGYLVAEALDNREETL